ncbi:unnamed protein product [Larinioides sclopetarius]|uniref:Uncharacterized protein n=1 Tax=Larinioides sclopetarius TaxID=280406 RepID=A0AAV1YZN1_9ARAC
MVCLAQNGSCISRNHLEPQDDVLCLNYKMICPAQNSNCISRWLQAQKRRKAQHWDREASHTKRNAGIPT